MLISRDSKVVSGDNLQVLPHTIEEQILLDTINVSNSALLHTIEDSEELKNKQTNLDTEIYRMSYCKKNNM